ncbi:MAG: CYTH domain-containing protein [Dehalococcoidia bacterium]|nr:CYTH domain-containing protein [Dehalococcoidia bacterium]
MTNSATVMETEWQFIADDLAAVRTWLDENTPDAFEVSAQPEREQHDEYWDTAGWLVWRAGFACRVRRRGETAELTLKELSGGDAHMRRRLELNEPIDALGGLAGNIARPAGEAGRLLRTLAGPHPLARVAALTTHRTTLTLADDAGRFGEVSLDRTTVGEGSRAHELQYVEVEVDSDAVDRARPFVGALQEGAGLRPAPTGKLLSLFT